MVDEEMEVSVFSTGVEEVGFCICGHMLSPSTAKRQLATAALPELHGAVEHHHIIILNLSPGSD